MSTSNYDVDLMERLRELEGQHLVAMRTDLPADKEAYERAKAEVDRRMAPLRVVVLGRRDVKGVAAA